MNSDLKKFYELSREERIQTIARECNLKKEEVELLKSLNADFKTMDRMSENVLGAFALPFSVAVNFKINGSDHIIPMVSEESSVVAAASNGAKLARRTGGFKAKSTEQIMIGQIILRNVKDRKKVIERIEGKKEKLLKKATNVDPVLKEKGGGAVGLEVLEHEGFLEVQLQVNVLDAMGANAVNTMCEALAPELEKLSGGSGLMKIVSNYAIKRIAKARAKWKKGDLGEKGVDKIIFAQRVAEESVFRAVTHNKGIMNGLSGLAIATGNDFRAIEAGAHAFACRSGTYSPLTKYCKDSEGNLIGEIELPVQAGIVGGTTRANPRAKLGLKILGVKSAGELSECFAALGLAQNFAALRAIVREGIQKGHMKLHAENIAVQAGAKGKQINKLAEKMIASGKISEGKAKKLLDLGEGK